MTISGKQSARLSRDFWLFWSGQTISNLGSSITMFALPLLIFKLTGSAIDLALATAAVFLPYLLFGLIIGAWVDRVDRKRLMIAVDLLQALAVASIPVANMFGILSIWWIYAVGFLMSTLAIAFQAAEFAAIPSLVDQNDLVTANGRIQASYSAVSVLGPIVAGIMVAFMPLVDLILFDTLSFLISASSLALIMRRFNTEGETRTTSIRQDIVEGLRYVLGHPVLRNISIMMALVNFFGATVGTQIVLFAKRQLQASDSEIGWIYSAGSVGVILLSLLAGTLRKRFTFSQIALSALAISGILNIAFAYTTNLYAALVLWALFSGLGILFNINTGSLRQTIVPNELLGRVMTIAGVLAWSAIPVGAFLGGYLIEQTNDVVLVYAAIGVITILIPLVFAFTALGRAERYLPKVKGQSDTVMG